MLSPCFHKLLGFFIITRLLLPLRNLHLGNETKIANENGVHHERNVLEEDQGCIDANISKLAPCISKDVQDTLALQNSKSYSFQK
jgi:hypothetical protein